MRKFISILLILIPVVIFGQPKITIDGSFDDWANVPVAVKDSADDVHHTDGYPDGAVPGYRKYDDVDLLEVKFINDAENLYGYISATGQIGRTSSDTLGHAKKGRYYFIFTIDVDNNDTTGYRLKEGGYYPDSKGYDVNMEVEFYNGGFNTGHYINHEFLTENQMQTQGIQDLADGVIRLAPGTYDYYTQWVTFEDSSYVLVSDKGPVYQGIITIAVSPDGHEAEMKAPMWGFLKTPEGEPIIDFGNILDVSASLEASGELADGGNGSSSNWGSDTAEPFRYLVTDPSTGVADNSVAKLPENAALHQNYPNPFNPSTKIEYNLIGEAFTSLKVFNVLGEEIRTLVSENQTPGLYRVCWDATDNLGNAVGSGIYLLRLQTNSVIRSRRMILLR